MPNFGLSYNTRKALCVQIGDEAGNEVADLLQRMAQRIETLERNKVNVTRIVPAELTAPAVEAGRVNENL